MVVMLRKTRVTDGWTTGVPKGDSPAGWKSTLPEESGVWYGSVFGPDYLAEGTIFTRGVEDMPLATNSPAIAAYMPQLGRMHNDRGTVTSLNTLQFNIPIYVVDSSVPGCPHAVFNVPGRIGVDAEVLNGRIPFPSWGYPGGPRPGGDESLAIYDRGTGIMREYFQVIKQSNGSWRSTSAGWFQADTNLKGLSELNYAMRLRGGTSSVVGMLNSLSQIGLAEARHGRIRHAVSFTISDAAHRVVSWPARGSDGGNTSGNAPAEGQWFRIPPSVDIDELGLRPFTTLIARAAQEYGGYAADRNLYCHAFNTEPPFVEQQVTGVNPWNPGGDIYAKYGDMGVNDFPWHLTEWAPVDWGKPSDWWYAPQQLD